MFKTFCTPRRPAFWIVIAIAIAAACASANKSHASTLDSGPYPDAAHERFSVTVSGQGPDVILIPGLASSAAVWDKTVSQLQGHYRLHVVNLAGFAGEPAGANASGDILPPTVEALDAYIKANHLQKPAVVGHSLGGLLALMLAKAHPEDTGRLVIADALPYVGVIFNPQATVAAMTPQAAALRDGMIGATDDAFKAQQTQSAAFLVSGPADQATVLGWSMASDRRVVAEAFYEDLTTDLRPDVAGIKTPTTLIYPVAPGQDEAMTTQVYTAAYTAMPHFSLAKVDNSRHFEMLDQPEAFEQALEAALK